MAKYFRIYCETDDKWEYLWNDPDIGITQCPTNNGHTVSLDSESPQQLIEEQAYVKIKEEVTPDGLPATGGHYFVETIIIDVEPGVTAFFNKSFPYPIGLIDVHFTSEENMRGDEIIACMACDTIIGALVADIEPGVTATDYGINVSDTVAQNVDVGYEIDLFDGVKSSELGLITKIHSSGINQDRLIMTKGPSETFLASSPTYIRMNIPMANLIIGPPQHYYMGQSSVGGQYVPTSINGRFIYKNNEGSAKKLYVNLEYFY